jgi:hypothetical protein
VITLSESEQEFSGLNPPVPGASTFVPSLHLAFYIEFRGFFVVVAATPSKLDSRSLLYILFRHF